MKKLFVTVVVLVVLIIVALLLKPTSPPEGLDQAKISDPSENSSGDSATSSGILEYQNILENNLSLNITGYGPGKTHPGTFSEYSVSNISTDSNGKITSGTVVIKSASREFGIDGLNNHLCTDEFLNCELHPDITFNLNSVTQTDTGFSVTGNLTFLGVTKSVTAPVQRIMNEFGEEAFSTDFRLDLAPFGYDTPLADSEVRIEIRTQ